MKTKLKNAYTKEEHVLRVLGISTETKRIIDCLIDVINDMPTEEATKHAYWTEKYDGYMILQECSICNAHTIIKSNYCPHCGAKMDEVTE